MIRQLQRILPLCLAVTVLCAPLNTKATISTGIEIRQPKPFDDLSDFLISAADARMMDIREGQLAIKKGTTEKIRNYGKLMVKDNTTMLAKIKRIAAHHKIKLPGVISADKQDGLDKLKSAEGRKFDRRFIRSMRIDHERDIKEFRKASAFSDKATGKFAAYYLPVLQFHLDTLNELRD